MTRRVVVGGVASKAERMACRKEDNGSAPGCPSFFPRFTTPKPLDFRPTQSIEAVCDQPDAEKS